MERKSRHFDMLSLSVGTFSQGYTQDFGCNDCIFRIGFIEVPTPEKHHCIGMFLFQVVELLHHRGHYHIFCHGFFPFYLLMNYYIQFWEAKIRKLVRISGKTC